MHLGTHLKAVEEAGKRYGLELHHSKFQLRQIQCDDHIFLPSGDRLFPMPSLEYLGASLSSDGHVGSELNRRIGIAKSEFGVLRKLWNHSALNLERKLI